MMKTFQAFFWHIVLGLVFLVLIGCVHSPEKQEPAGGAAQEGPTAAEVSFGRFADRLVDGTPLAAHMEARVFRVLANTVPARENGAIRSIADLKAVDPNKPQAYGWAVPLTDDGYFLTAAHLLHKAPGPHYLLNAKTGELSSGPVRVVWDGWDGIDSEELEVLIPADFAIVHTSLQSDAYAVWAWDWELRPGTEFVAPGGIRFWPPRLTAGSLMSVQQGLDGYGRVWPDDRIGTVVLWHGAHIGRGDSGSPVFLPNGRLAAITIGGGTRRAFAETPVDGSGAAGERVPVAAAVRPDPDSVMETIRRDRLRITSESFGSPPRDTETTLRQ